MKVKDIMTDRVVFLYEDEPIGRAVEILDSQVFRHLPVLSRDGELVGIVSDRDLRTSQVVGDFLNEQLNDAMPEMDLKMLMTPNPYTIGPGDDLSFAARLMGKFTISALPVLEGNSLVGILTTTDILELFAKMVDDKPPVPED